jgi:thiol:disulfide interchange protein DsbD
MFAFVRDFCGVVRLRSCGLLAPLWLSLWRRLLLSLWLSMGLGFSGAAWAQAWSAQAAVVSTPQVRAELVAHAPQGVQVGPSLWVGLRLQHAREWHTYWRNPGDSGLPTQMTWQLPAGVQAGDVIWPLPQKLRAGPLTNYGFEGDTLLVVPLTVGKNFQPTQGKLDLQMHANWLVCRLECIPQEGDFTLSIAVHSSHAPMGAVFDAVLTQQPQALTNASAEIRFDANNLRLEVRGLPSALHQQTLQIFPTTAELISSAAELHPKSTQSWQGDVWTARMPLSHMRNSDPRKVRWLLTHGQGTQRQGFWVDANVKGTWPATDNLAADDTLDSNANTLVNTDPSGDGLSWGFALALLGALVGGLLLNLMPCVLPVLAIKLLGFAQHSQQHRAHRVAGLSYTVGVVLSFVLLGGVVLVLRASGEQLGWGFQLQSPWVVSGLAVLFTLIALNLLGLFEVGQLLPSHWVSHQAKHPVMDAFLSGVLAVAVASPCTAPFMGASLGLAMTLPAWQALMIFATMGVGLSLPYLLASWWPALVKLLPQPGAWMLAVRQLFAFPMLGTVIWLLWVLGLQHSLDVAIGLLTMLLVLSALVWTLRFKARLARVLGVCLALVLAWLSTSLAMALNLEPSKTSTAVAAMEAPVEQAVGGSAKDTVTWQAWSPAAVAQSLAQGRPVFIDFTAAWCVTCQINKKITLSNAEVLQAFKARRVTLLRADWTRRDPAITDALTALGRSGVPVYVLQAPGQSPVVLSELLRVNELREALSHLPSN